MTTEIDDAYLSLEFEDNIAYVCIDVEGEKLNKLSPAMLDSFEEVIIQLRSSKDLEGAVLYSGKEDNFIAGFDIEVLQQYTEDSEGLEDLLKRGHRMMNRFEQLSLPIVAAIDGTCLGGGLELALACDARVATDTDATELGAPEVQLGLIPGAGGTQRLPRTIDLQTALDMILTGKSLGHYRAEKTGLIEEAVHPGILLDVAADHARDMYHKGNREGGIGEEVREFFSDPATEAMDLAAHTPARKLIFNQTRKMVQKKSGRDYPAPFKAIEVIETGLKEGMEAGLEAEAEAFVELIEGEVAPNLINIFFMKTELDNADPFPEDVEPVDVDKIGVLGAGLMGAGIAQVGAYNDYAVRLKDKDLEGLGWGLNYCKDIFDKAVRKHKLTEPKADVKYGNITGTTTYDGFKTCDLVIEAVFEDLDLKQKMLADVEEHAAEDVIFASNTSTIPISDIAENARKPENVLGMHFFSPVYKMPLLEIIKTEETSDEAVATALEVGKNIGKTCIVVKDGPGFFTSRVIGAYVNEAGWLLEEGASIEAIDSAMEDFGFPVGPMKLLDEVGIDVGLKAGGVLADAFSERWNAPDLLETLVDNGRKGKKNGKGLYIYDDEGENTGEVDKSVYEMLNQSQQRTEIAPEIIKRRCWLSMLNECAYCLEEGIAEKPRDIDIGVIFGLGFPPFKGGALRYADNIGLQTVAYQLKQLADEYGDRLQPADIIVDRAEKGETFYQ
jgi:3-hydroxyacyl-CoA dehydrogenase/enoyl-CoA hydratase/3-hydroxybutyryl-CoA epimerase